MGCRRLELGDHGAEGREGSIGSSDERVEPFGIRRSGSADRARTHARELPPELPVDPSCQGFRRALHAQNRFHRRELLLQEGDARPGHVVAETGGVAEIRRAVSAIVAQVVVGRVLADTRITAIGRAVRTVEADDLPVLARTDLASRLPTIGSHDPQALHADAEQPIVV